MPKTRSAPPGSAPLARAAQVLDAVACAREGVSLSQIARQISLPLSTTHRLVRNLAGIDFIEETERGAYRIGPRIRSLFHLAASGADIETSARPVLQQLAASVQQTSFLTRLHGTRLVLVLTATPPQVNRVLVQPGNEFPIHATASGKAIFAFQSAAVLREVLREPRRKYRPNTIVAAEKIRAELEIVRKQGYAECDDELDAGVYAAAAPVRAGDAGVLYALGIVGLTSSMFENCSRRDLIARIRKGAADIESRLAAPFSGTQS